MKKLISIWTVLMMTILLQSCGSASSAGSQATQTVSEESFSASGADITIDDIVNDSSASTSLNNSLVTTSISALFYFGRFIYTNGSNVFAGSIKFKINKQDSSSAYFSDFTLEHMSEITAVNNSIVLVPSSTDLDVTAQYNSMSNHVSIANATSRFVAFDIDFGNNDYFGDVTDAGVLFSADFSTMVGGNDSSFFFIAQKISSQPDVSTSTFDGAWNVVNFTVDNSSGYVLIDSTSTVSVGGVGGNGFTGFTGTNSLSGDFDGELSLTDSTAGCFIYGYGLGDGTMTALGPINGGFLVSADQNLAVGVDLDSGLYFAAER